MLGLIGLVVWTLFIFFAGMMVNHILLQINRNREVDRTFKKLNVVRKLL